MNFKQWCYQMFAAIDQVFSGLATPFSGDFWADETLSSRSYRRRENMAFFCLMIVIDIIFRPFQGPNHCKNAYEKEKSGYHRPPEMR